ncbi:MAG TPA: hypothetical protein VM846_03585 [Vicinamibacterales bacterium]|nr:hypothetical protein [Vicinamibacterales bacterium]
MTIRSLPYLALILAIAFSARLAVSAQGGGGIQPGTVKRADPIKASEVPSRKRAAPIPPRGTYVPPRTPWGDPDIAGAYNNSDESGIPFERPDEFASRRLQDFTPAELAALTKQRQQQTIERAPALSEFPGATSPMHWFENYFAANSRAWLVSDPPDGRVPPVTDEGRKRAADRTAARKGRGPADSWEDRSLYDRCITRGVPGSMMPAIYGNSYQIQQGPGVVTITYEMVHDTRVIHVDNRPHVSSKIRQYLGDARGRWDGNTLVVETTNFNDRVPYRGSSENLKIVERFTPIGPDTLEWAITFEDPHTWARPWTFAMNLTHDESQPPFEYACHEGNYGLRNILSAARAEERMSESAVREANRPR